MVSCPVSRKVLICMVSLNREKLQESAFLTGLGKVIESYNTPRKLEKDLMSGNLKINGRCSL